MNPVIVAIDGEASTGKSTQAKKIAEELDFDYRDSGAYYRALTLYLIQNNINSNEDISQTILDKIDLKQTFKDNKLIMYLLEFLSNEFNEKEVVYGEIEFEIHLLKEVK